MEKVSVIIPFYQAEKWLGEAVDSCIEQADYIKEIILVDDFSTDGSWQVAESYQQRYPDIVKPFKNTRKGGNFARNFGLSQSTGTYIQWLDADDKILPGKLSAQISFLEQDENIDIVYSDWQLNTFDQLGELKRVEFKKAKDYPDYCAELLKDNWLPPHSYLLTSRVACQASNDEAWNPQTTVGQDREYFTNLALSGAAFAYVPGNFCIYNRRLSQPSVSRALKMKDRTTHINKMLYIFIEKINNSKGIQAAVKEQYKKILLTQILYSSVVFGKPVKTNDFSFRNIDWSLIKGMRSKIRVALKLLSQGLLIYGWHLLIS